MSRVTLIDRLRPLQKSLEQKILSYGKTHVLEIEIFFVVLCVLAALGKIPYVNIIFTKQLSTLILILFGSYVFRVKKQILLIVVAVFFLAALVLTLAGQLAAAEEMGTLIYALLWFIVTLYVKDIWLQL